MKKVFLAVLVILLAASASAKVCTAGPACDDANPCTFDNCISQLCSNVPVANNTPCGNGNVCSNGACVSPLVAGIGGNQLPGGNQAPGSAILGIDNTVLLIAGVVIAIILVIAIVFLLKRKKK